MSCDGHVDWMKNLVNKNQSITTFQNQFKFLRQEVHSPVQLLMLNPLVTKGFGTHIGHQGRDRVTPQVPHDSLDPGS